MHRRHAIWSTLVAALVVALALPPTPALAAGATIDATITAQSPTALTIDVEGSGFPTDPPGIYVGVTESDGFSSTDAGRFRATQFLPSLPGGGFARTLSFTPAEIASLDPDESYSVFTLRAHGMADPDGAYLTEQELDLDFVALGLVEPEPTTPTTTPTTVPTSAPTATPTTAPTTAPTTTPPAPGAPLAWGVKKSFRDYVSGSIARGTIAVTDGAQTAAGGEFVWPWRSSVDRTTTFGGAVRFTGHGGQLDVTISSPSITVTSGSTADLSVEVNGRRVVMATVDLARPTVQGSTATFSQAPVTLAASGVSVFALNGSGFYSAGTPLDPASFSLPASALAGAPAATTPPPRATTTTKKATKATKAAGRAGELTWGVKSSFRSYITGPIAKGTVSVSGGASATGGGYRFGQASTSATPPNAVGTTGYRGAVRFSGHGGQLDMTLSQPSVRVTSASTAVLSLTVSGRGRVDLANLDLSRAARSTASGWVQYAGAPATLTAAGSLLFSYGGSAFYPAGSAVDPVTFSIGSTAATATTSSVVAAAAASAAWTPPATPPATTGLTVESGEVRAGEEITVSGDGFAANETGIKVVLYSTPVVLAEDAVADASGRATWTGAIPPTVAAGEHTLTFQGSVDRGVVIDVAAPAEIVGCPLTEGRLDWGFKESFRAYVSGSIANGDWSTRGNASYATPQFTWAQGAGVMAEDGSKGDLGFTGTVEFTGHDGALDTTLSDPVVTFGGDDTAVLSLDYAGTTMDDAMAGEGSRETKADVPFADLDLDAGTRTVDGGQITIADVPATLTVAGSAAFPNYETGAALDPVTLTWTAATDCEPTTAAPAEPADEAAAAVADVAGADALPAWTGWIGGAVLGALLASAATVLLMRRRTPGAGA